MRATGFSWITHNQPRGDKSPAGVGGVVEQFTAGGNLNTGDCVFVSAANTVNKSGTVADYNGFVGVVVGGKNTNDNITTAVGVSAASTGQSVLVQVAGIATVVAAGTITAGTNFGVIPDTSTAGRVVAGSHASHGGYVLGTPITTGAAAGTLKILIAHR